jgi:hypothetical protein
LAPGIPWDTRISASSGRENGRPQPNSHQLVGIRQGIADYTRPSLTPTVSTSKNDLWQATKEFSELQRFPFKNKCPKSCHKNPQQNGWIDVSVDVKFSFAYVSFFTASTQKINRNSKMPKINF